MTYQEKKNEQLKHSSISFDSLEDLVKEIESIKNSNIKKLSLCKSEIGDNNWEVVRNVVLDYFAYTDMDIVAYV